ncbi:Bromodomain-containing protein [Neocallimastix lanati (nom. inval.)]|uniref:Bromodomain-containing protein n=1 Tax=Neocallimastix californiae TaxID=1754190 RepID=A0A1Y2DKL5_9FUNG|nr:Bromodomain-containing protein [Neocallimastix sp. JGI-2020a]ORY59807.1 Bromodomain-containing protein [Neocallimastix californiae]|eukprot:ORY59807.1 Bromodomain-containing protein [Neocallimastix californiae]
MDLSTIMKKIKNNRYKSINDYISDIELMFNNCFTYNPPTNSIHIEGLASKDYFIEQLRRLSPEVQVFFKIITKENGDEYLHINGKKPKRQIKMVQHLELESYHFNRKHDNDKTTIKNLITSGATKIEEPQKNKRR